MHRHTHVLSWAKMDATTAHDVFRLRQQVFVVEQGDPYDDLDGRDTEPGTVHVVLRDDADEVVGVARVLDDGDEWRIDFTRFNQYKEAAPAVDSGGWAWSTHGVWDSHVPECFPFIRFTTHGLGAE